MCGCLHIKSEDARAANLLVQENETKFMAINPAAKDDDTAAVIANAAEIMEPFSRIMQKVFSLCVLLR